VRDGAGVCQAVIFRGNVAEEDFEIAKALTQESSVIVRGVVKADRARQGYQAATRSTCAASRRLASPTRTRFSPRSTASSF
jgi:aspartyl/asparaginyl-tRNA synthetase